MEHCRKGRLHVAANGGEYRHPPVADARADGYYGYSRGFFVPGTGDGGQRFLADPDPKGGAVGGGLQVGIRLQYRGFGAAVPAVGGGDALDRPFLRDARVGADRSGVVPACASQCPVRDSEYDFHPAVPFRPAFEGRFYFVARKRTGGYRYGLGRMRYLEPGGATGSGDGCTGHVAVGVERLAPSGGFRRGPSACDGSV